MPYCGTSHDSDPWMVTLEVTSNEPSKRLISYVDNWTMTASSVPQLCPMLEQLCSAPTFGEQSSQVV